MQGERNAKRKSENFRFALPSRRLPYLKVVQGERQNESQKTFDLHCRAALPFKVEYNQNVLDAAIRGAGL